MLFKSQQSQTLSSIGTAPVEFPRWMDRIGPNGGRIVTDYFYVFAVGTVTVGTADWQGEDVARLAASLRVEQEDNTLRWSLPGDLSRIASYAFLGAERMFEHADVAQGAGAAVNYCWQLPMRKPQAHTPGDFSLAVEEFKRLVIQTNTLAGAATGTTALTVPSFTFYVIAHCREEMDVRIKCTDEVSYENFSSLAQGMFTVAGKLHDFLLQADGASGGASLANLTDVRIDTLNFPTLLASDLRTVYKNKRQAANNLSTTQAAAVRSDPFVFPIATEKALAVLLHDHETSPWHGKIVEQQMKVDLTNTVASLRGVKRVIVPTSQASRNRTAALYGLKPADFRVATAAKSSRDPAAWPVPLRPFLPLKADLRSA